MNKIRITGGEPLVRKKDLIRLCEKHDDAAFLSFTNATLIDEEFCQDLLRVRRGLYVGDQVTMEIWRDGQRLEVTLELNDAAS